MFRLKSINSSVGGVHIVGGERGDAFIAFHTDDDARQAMQKDGGLICNQSVKLFLSSKIEMQNVIAAARGKPSASANPVTNPVQQSQPTSIPQQKRLDPLSQQFSHDIDENQQQQTSTQSSTTQSTNDPMSSFLDVVNKIQQQKPNASATSLSNVPTAASVLPTAAAAPAGTGLGPANLVLQFLQSNLGSIPPNILAQVQGQLASQGKRKSSLTMIYLMHYCFFPFAVRFRSPTKSNSSTISCSSGS